MSTYFIHTKLPLNNRHLWALAGVHAESSGGASLSIIYNYTKDEAIIKVKSDHDHTEFIPHDMQIIQIMDELTDINTFLLVNAWHKTSLE